MSRPCPWCGRTTEPFHRYCCPACEGQHRAADPRAYRRGRWAGLAVFGVVAAGIVVWWMWGR